MSLFNNLTDSLLGRKPIRTSGTVERCCLRLVTNKGRKLKEAWQVMEFFLAEDPGKVVWTLDIRKKGNEFARFLAIGDGIEFEHAAGADQATLIRFGAFLPEDPPHQGQEGKP